MPSYSTAKALERAPAWGAHNLGSVLIIIAEKTCNPPTATQQNNCSRHNSGYHYPFVHVIVLRSSFSEWPNRLFAFALPFRSRRADLEKPRIPDWAVTAAHVVINTLALATLSVAPETT